MMLKLIIRKAYTMPTLTTKIFFNSRLLAVLFLGFSAGLPVALISSTLQAWFTDAHIDLITIGSLSLLGLPFTLKFLWAPFMDYIHLPKLGKRRGWILLMQFGLVIMLFLLAQFNPAFQASQIGLIALAIAFFSASQDIAIDAYRTDILMSDERGLGASYYVFSYRIATLISGGLALISADYLGWQITYQLMAVMVLLAMIPAYLAPQPVELILPAQNLWQSVTHALQDFFQRDQVGLLLLFIVFYKFGDALALSLMTNFLLNGLGFTLTEVGLAYKLVSIVAIILGSFIGGVILTRLNIFWGLLIFGITQAFSNLSFAILAVIGKQFWAMTTAVFIENFCSGLSTVAFMAFLMSLCHRRYTATQYALLSAIASLGRVFLGPIAGVMVQNIGWTHFFIASFLLCFPGIIALIFLRKEVLAYAHATAN